MNNGQVDNMKTLVIAEAGSNHNQDWSLATQLIKSAHSSGCQIVKFQTFSSNTLYRKNTPDFGNNTNIPDLIRNIEMPRYWQTDLKMYCDDLGIEFMSTPFDENAIDELVHLGVKRLKIAGFEALDFRFLKLAASTKLPLIVTFGVGTNWDVRKDIIYCIMEENPDVWLTILHGNHSYPSPVSNANLGTMNKIRRQTELMSYDGLDWVINPVQVGLSDHTEGILIPPVAVALGAQVIEKHFTISRDLDGPDHAFAIEPSELLQMVNNIKTVETSLGVRDVKVTESEKQSEKARRAVHSKGFIRQGEVFSENNITTKRPYIEGRDVPASEYFNILGQKALEDIQPDHSLAWKKHVAPSTYIT